MFTGIIERTVWVRFVEPMGSGLRLGLENPFSDVAIGESIAVNGTCLTADAQTDARHLSFFLSSETLARTLFGRLRANDRVNLERALLPTTRLSGHYVTGHVDGVGTIVELSSDGQAYDLVVRIPHALARYCVEKGSIAIDGISLTVNAVEADDVRIKIVPHTWTSTNLSDRAVGDSVHVEVDLLAKYAQKQPHVQQPMEQNR